MSAGRLSRPAALNDIIHRTLATVNTPSILEPNDVSRDGGKRPDGMTLVPWKMGRCSVGRYMRVHAGNVPSSTNYVEAAETKKVTKYRGLGSQYHFMAFQVETFRPWVSSGRKLYNELSKRLVDTTGDQRAGGFLAQRISIAIKRGNPLFSTVRCYGGTIPNYIIM
jgi:hypothetical protein